MTVQAILAPVFALVLLAFVLLVAMGRTRFAAVRARQVPVTTGSPRRFDWPATAAKVSDCFHNQLELPIFFYVAVILGLVTKSADLVFVALSWVFVGLRYAHAYEHTGANRTKWRFRLFVAGFVVLAALWIWLALNIFVGL